MEGSGGARRRQRIVVDFARWARAAAAPLVAYPLSHDTVLALGAGQWSSTQSLRTIQQVTTDEEVALRGKSQCDQQPGEE